MIPPNFSGDDALHLPVGPTTHNVPAKTAPEVISDITVGPDPDLLPTPGGYYSATARVAPQLPVYTGGKTSGVLRYGDVDIPLLSGYNGPSASMPKGTVPGMHGRIKSHVEAHAASVMRQQNLKEATLYINRIPCPTNNPRSPGCFDNLPKMLPEGARLRVIGPDGFEHVFVGMPD